MDYFSLFFPFKWNYLLFISDIICTFDCNKFIYMNPFLQNFRLQVIKVNSTYYETKTSNVSDGIVGKFKKVEESFLAEKQEKSSVYEIPYIENILFREMSPSGRDLLLYIIYNLEKDCDVITLKEPKVSSSMHISRGKFYTGINDLTDNAIICKKHTSEYWINPFYLFKGNRIDYYHKMCESCVDIVAQVIK